ncbi:putative methylesterase 11, chloroplastic [Nicotiana attenuata]|uniref:Putative methylesterase 11, chloroplastic n=1 Tax=Nicotiana attenuata TaxID=49451 RepID=A0A1J6JQE4_NICAT|nr:putative methylesterase 11, chloroplastic [Nicotiana attenuata]OIT39230.1 putative methylesterase 11, chloroplastic [Nicotiana attenuata]
MYSALTHILVALNDVIQEVNCLEEAAKELTIDNLKKNHYILVDCGGLRAWCWYKTIALLDKAGFKMTAVKLTSSNIHSVDTNSITSLSQHAKPLNDFLKTLVYGERVYLVVPAYHWRWSSIPLQFQKQYLLLQQIYKVTSYSLAIESTLVWRNLVGTVLQPLFLT